MHPLYELLNREPTQREKSIYNVQKDKPNFTFIKDEEGNLKSIKNEDT